MSRSRDISGFGDGVGCCRMASVGRGLFIIVLVGGGVLGNWLVNFKESRVVLGRVGSMV